jgi:multidrug efflux pump
VNLPDFCIRRPIAATMFNLALALVGLVALSRLPVRELPDIDPPVVSATTVYPGANAELVEADVTEPLEQEINNIPGIKILRSESREQVSIITVEFELNHSVDIGAQDIRDRISRVRDKLPEDIKEPIVAKQDADAQEVMWIALFSESRSTLELSNLAERQIRDRLQVVPGVGGINFGGQKRPSMRIWLDSTKMAARQITAADIRALLQRENVELPSGRIEGEKRSLSIVARGRMDQPEQYADLIVREVAGSPVRLRDVATIEIGPEVEDTIARFNGKPAVGLGVVKQSDANAIDVARRVRAEIERIRPLLPPEGLDRFEVHQGIDGQAGGLSIGEVQLASVGQSPVGDPEGQDGVDDDGDEGCRGEPPVQPRRHDPHGHHKFKGGRAEIEDHAPDQEVG